VGSLLFEETVERDTWPAYAVTEHNIAHSACDCLGILQGEENKRLRAVSCVVKVTAF
jgi:hypothetical protein